MAAPADTSYPGHEKTTPSEPFWLQRLTIGSFRTDIIQCAAAVTCPSALGLTYVF